MRRRHLPNSPRSLSSTSSSVSSNGLSGSESSSLRDDDSNTVTSPTSTHSSSPHLSLTHPFYSFVHDRIQQGAYLAIPEAVRASTHLQIARLLLGVEKSKMCKDHSNQEQKHQQQQATVLREGRSFEIANHFLKGAEVLRAESSTDAEVLQVAAFLADTATAGKQAGSYQSGLGYAQCAQWLLRLERVRAADRDC